MRCRPRSSIHWPASAWSPRRWMSSPRRRSSWSWPGSSRHSCTDHRRPCGIVSGAWRSAASSSCRSSAGPSLAGDCRSCRRPSRVRAESARGREGEDFRGRAPTRVRREIAAPATTGLAVGKCQSSIHAGAEPGPIGLQPDRGRLGLGIPRDRLAGPRGDREERMAPRGFAARRRPGVAGDSGGALAAARARSVGRAENRRQPVDPGHLGHLSAGRALARVLARLAGIDPPARAAPRARPRQAVRRALPVIGSAGGRRLLVPSAGLVRPPSPPGRMRIRLRRLRGRGGRAAHRLCP